MLLRLAIWAVCCTHSRLLDSLCHEVPVLVFREVVLGGNVVEYVSHDSADHQRLCLWPNMPLWFNPSDSFLKDMCLFITVFVFLFSFCLSFFIAKCPWLWKREDHFWVNYSALTYSSSLRIYRPICHFIEGSELSEILFCLQKINISHHQMRLYFNWNFHFVSITFFPGQEMVNYYIIEFL